MLFGILVRWNGIFCRSIGFVAIRMNYGVSKMFSICRRMVHRFHMWYTYQWIERLLFVMNSHYFCEGSRDTILYDNDKLCRQNVCIIDLVVIRFHQISTCFLFNVCPLIKFLIVTTIALFVPLELYKLQILQIII